jgi:hypothetical protein
MMDSSKEVVGLGSSNCFPNEKDENTTRLRMPNLFLSILSPALIMHLELFILLYRLRIFYYPRLLRGYPSL